MEPKSVLVCYSDRKKVFKIDPKKQMSDIEFLTMEFKKEFSFETQVNVSVTFQRFDPEWGESVDLDIDSDINHKDKLVAVVMPVLQTPNLSSGDKESTLSLQVNTSNVEETPSRSLLATPHALCEDDIQSIAHSSETGTTLPVVSDNSSDEIGSDVHVAKQPRLVMSEYTYDSGVVAKQQRPVKSEDPCDSGVVARLVKSEDPYDSGVVAKRPRLVKSEDDSTPLPDPFPLPKHYHHNVDSALRSKKMSTKDKQQFISEVASAMLQYKNIHLVMTMCVLLDPLWQSTLFLSRLMLSLM